eukprot:TRINITY_DN2022_c0_g1_i3.p4 TRINITY_DN2022_c0_g1~~TRINITY_DN2022_c0_g1_i3.p4  ORF type:complete len:349 (-),score=48.54 TRINITY_DN2022_c0_g1_i3:206-1252(-)
MRWRAAPRLEVDKMSAVSCLLLGAGTLGCVVARCLQGWGVRKMTLIDNAEVSYSNPVRQWLYNHEDAATAAPKAEAAAKRLQDVFPGTQSTGSQLSIPMPGHPPPPTEVDTQKNNYLKLKQLIQEHDVVFLLMDSRESRWLPTALCSAYNVPCFNAALGFSSFVVMRHGHGALCENLKGERLGCYFCQDVVAPANSQTNRTLDQQCTVARPGLSPIAGSLAVELLASMIQHPLKQAAPADSEDNALGGLPHMLRGELGSWEIKRMNFPAYPQCTACSQIVAEHLVKEDWNFVLQVLCQNNYLEDMTGLSKWKEEMEKLIENQQIEEQSNVQSSSNVNYDYQDDDWTEL